jgi:hypothetical protein
MEPEEPTSTAATAVVDEERAENPPSEEPVIVLGYN